MINYRLKIDDRCITGLPEKGVHWALKSSFNRTLWWWDGDVHQIGREKCIGFKPSQTQLPTQDTIYFHPCNLEYDHIDSIYTNLNNQFLDLRFVEAMSLNAKTVTVN